MKDINKGRFAATFGAIAIAQWLGFPLISWLFGLGDRLQAPSWIVIVLTSGIMATFAEGARQAKRS